MTTRLPEIERRGESSLVELRGGGSRRAGGIAMAYGHQSRQMSSYVEVFEKSAFNKSESDGWHGVRSYVEHDPTKLLADTATRTLTLVNNETCLDYELVLPNTTVGNDALINIETGLLRYSSVGFRTYQDDFTVTASGLPLRHIVSARLDEVSLTANPAYYSTSLGLRSIEVGLRSFAAHLGEDPDDVIRDGLNGDLRHYVIRTDRAATAPPTVRPHNESREDRGIDPRKALAWLESRKPQGMDGSTAQRILETKRMKWAIEQSDREIAGLRRQPYQPDLAAQQREQQVAAHNAAVYEEAVRRRVTALHQAGYDLPDTGTGAVTAHPAFGTSSQPAQWEQTPIHNMTIPARWV